MQKSNNGSIQSTQQAIIMKNGSTFSIPASWEMKIFEHHVRMTTPEQDCRAYFLELPYHTNQNNVDELINGGWKQVLAECELPSTEKAFPIFSGDWDESYKTIYDIPISESRSIMAILRVFHNMAYLCLIDGKIAALSRRGPELNLMIESWKPLNFKTSLLNHQQPCLWTQKQKDEFDLFISESMRKLHIPGAAITIIQKEGTVLFSKGFGVKKIGEKNPITPDTLFMIGSSTKPLTTLLMGMLVDQNRLQWDTPVVDILDSFCLGDTDLTRSLTIRQMASASTGMPRRDMDWVFKYKGIKAEDRLLQMKHMKPTTKMGETYQYSNYLVMAGGYAAARTYIPKGGLDNAYSQAMQQLVFDPLQMKKTVLSIEHATQLGAAFPHAINYNGQLIDIPIHIEASVQSMAPSGGVWSTVNDMAAYLMTEMNNGMLHGKRVISEESILERRKPVVRMGEKSHYGLGLIIAEQQGLNFTGHGGNTFGFSSDVFFIPEKGLGVVILTNSYGANSFLYAVKQKIIELSFSATPRSEQMVYFATKDCEKLIKNAEQSLSRTSEKLEWINHIIGKYFNSHLGYATIQKTSHGTGYAIEFDDWCVSITGERDKQGNKLLVLIDAPSHGSMKLLVRDNKLILDAEQIQYAFLRIS